VGVSARSRRVTQVIRKCPGSEDIIFRRVTTTAAKSGAAYPIGTSTINVTNCSAGWGGVVPGDTFGTYPYAVSNTVAPVAGVMTGVTFTPAITMALTNGSALSFNHAIDTTVRAEVTSFDQAMIAMGVVSISDLKVTMSAIDNTGSALPTPIPTDKLVIGGKVLSVGAVRQIRIDGQIVMFEIQAKG